MGLINAIQSIAYFTRGGRLVRWESHKHPRDSHGRFSKVGGSSAYIYGRGEQVSFDGMGANGNNSPSGIVSRNSVRVDLSPGDRVYVTATGSRVVHHADGTGTVYVGASAYDKVHLNSRGVQTILNDPQMNPKLVHAVPGQIVQANSEQEAEHALHGPSQRVEHPLASGGAIHVRVPHGSIVHKTDKHVVVEHTDGTATVYNAKRGTYREERNAGRVIEGHNPSEVSVNHPQSKNGVVRGVPKKPGDIIYPVDGGIVIRHKDGDGTYYPIKDDGWVDQEGVETIPEGRVSDVINQNGGAHASETVDRFIRPSSVDVPNGTERKVETHNGEVSYTVAPGDVAISTRNSVVVVSPDGSGRAYSANSERVRKYDDARKEIPILRPKPRNVRLGNGETIEVSSSRIDHQYISKNSVIVQDSITGAGVHYQKNADGSITKKNVSENEISDILKNAGDTKHKQSYVQRKGAILPGHGTSTPSSVANDDHKDSSRSIVTPSEDTPERPQEPSVDVSDRSTDRSTSSPSEAVRRARAAAIANGSLPSSPDTVDTKMQHPDLGDISMKVEPGSSIRQVDNGYVVTYTNSSKPAILFKPDGHSLTGLTKREIDGLPVIAQINSDGSVVDFHNHEVFGGTTDKPVTDANSALKDIPESLLIFVDSEEERQNFLKLMREQGIEELDGIPIELKLQVRKGSK